MKQYILNGASMATREAAHDEIVRALPLPEYYGRNLDALWDELGCLQGEILLANAASITGYGAEILTLLREAAEENPRLTLTIQA